jgi:hypothetical protein
MSDDWKDNEFDIYDAIGTACAFVLAALMVLLYEGYL